MNKQLSILLVGTIGSANYLDRVSGLAQVVTTIIPGEGDTSTQKKFPVTSFTTAEQCSGKTHELYDLIPDSSKKSLLYFEENGATSLIEKKTAGNIYQSRLRLICWLNPNRISNASNKDNIGVAVMNDIIKRLTAQSYFHDTINRLFASVVVKVEAIPEKNPNLFSKYDYSEKETQFLMHPFDYFGLDLLVQYMVPYACINNFSPTAPTTEC